MQNGNSELEPLKVYLLTILTNFGSEFFIFSEGAVAEKQLFNYVQGEWDFDDEMPTEEHEAVYEYFRRMNGKETYILVEEKVMEEPV